MTSHVTVENAIDLRMPYGKSFSYRNTRYGNAQLPFLPLICGHGKCQKSMHTDVPLPLGTVCMTSFSNCTDTSTYTPVQISDAKPALLLTLTLVLAIMVYKSMRGSGTSYAVGYQRFLTCENAFDVRRVPFFLSRIICHATIPFNSAEQVL